jgi:hypothetical protein
MKYDYVRRWASEDKIYHFRMGSGGYYFFNII